MNANIFFIAKFNKEFNRYLPKSIDMDTIYQSEGLRKHIEKRHPECIDYLPLIPNIIEDPDYIGINPNESGTSFELVKTFDNNVQIGIKLDSCNEYLYVATLHTITESKLEHGINNGRLKRFDKYT